MDTILYIVGNPLLYTVGYFLSEAPWYFIATVPFWGSERIKKNYVILIILAVVLLRTLAGYLLTVYVPNGVSLNDAGNMLRPFILLAVYAVCYKVHIAKLLYAILLITTLALPIDFLASLLSLPFWMPKLLEGTDNIVIVAEPSWIIAVTLLMAASLPFVYRLFHGLVRRALSELSARTVFFLCATPALFYTVYVGSVFSSSFTNHTILFVIPFSGLFCAFINLRMIMDTMKDMQTKRDLAVEKLALERVNILKTDLIRTISHEMKTPLAVMMGFAQLTAAELKDKGADEQTCADLDALALEAQRLARLVDELQKSTLSGQYEKIGQAADAALVIRQIAKLYAPIMERNKNRLTLDIQDGLPPASCYPNELTQILFNLLNNADKHTQNGEIKVTAALDNEVVAVTVTDTGCGISPELLPHVFEQYFSGEEGGTGLGLFICKEIIEKCGGSITIDSTTGQGTVVRFVLPVWKDGEADA